eukprot:Rhum_TRINITY_DN5163_c0_g1::Rhum_TRINITY_DN5163_c0_g1_i1::g.16675::m.16675
MEVFVRIYGHEVSVCVDEEATASSLASSISEALVAELGGPADTRLALVMDIRLADGTVLTEPDTLLRHTTLQTGGRISASVKDSACMRLRILLERFVTCGTEPTVPVPGQIQVLREIKELVRTSPGGLLWTCIVESGRPVLQKLAELLQGVSTDGVYLAAWSLLHICSEGGSREASAVIAAGALPHLVRLAVQHAACYVREACTGCVLSIAKVEPGAVRQASRMLYSNGMLAMNVATVSA